MQHDKMRLVSAGTPLVIGRSGCGVGAAGGDEDKKVGMLVGMKTKRWGCWWGRDRKGGDAGEDEDEKVRHLQRDALPLVAPPSEAMRLPPPLPND